MCCLNAMNECIDGMHWLNALNECMHAIMIIAECTTVQKNIDKTKTLEEDVYYVKERSELSCGKWKSGEKKGKQEKEWQTIWWIILKNIQNFLQERFAS